MGCLWKPEALDPLALPLQENVSHWAGWEPLGHLSSPVLYTIFPTHQQQSPGENAVSVETCRLSAQTSPYGGNQGSRVSSSKCILGKEQPWGRRRGNDSPQQDWAPKRREALGTDPSLRDVNTGLSGVTERGRHQLSPIWMPSDWMVSK